MRDEMDMRIMNEHRGAFLDLLRSAAASMRVVFIKLRDIEYDAPWHHQDERCL